MAKLDSAQLISFTAATSALALSTSRKLIRNFRYYRDGETDAVNKEKLRGLCRNIRRDAFGLHNLMENEPSHPAFFVALARQIDDQLEELHRNLLFYSAVHIAEIIPIVDRQRAFWGNLADPHFYDNHLIHALEHNIPDTLNRIENLLNRLPDFAST